jgi:hypothetical protein
VEEEASVGMKYRVRFEPINFEIEIGHEEAVRWERRAFFTRSQRRGRGMRELAPGKGSML